MSAASDFLENKLLDHTLKYGTAPYVGASTLYLALFTASTGLEANSPSAEISTSGTAYARKAVTFATASSGSSATNATVTFDAATASWGSVTHVAVMDASTSGNVLFWGAVTTAKTIDSGDTFQVTSGNLTIALA
jgi:hypothetical protein